MTGKYKAAQTEESSLKILRTIELHSVLTFTVYYQCKAADIHSSLADENFEEFGTQMLLTAFMTELLFQNTSDCSALILQMQWEHPHIHAYNIYLV